MAWTALLLAASALAAPDVRLAYGDRFFDGRPDREKLEAAFEAWRTVLEDDPKSLEALARLARGYYFAGTHGPDDRERRLADLEKAVEYAKTAVAVAPDRVEGHFWLGAAWGGWAQEKGILKSLKLAKPIRASFEKAAELDPRYLSGSPLRALGRYYFKLPGLFGGSKKKSRELLDKAKAIEPDDTLNRLFLAETLEALGMEKAAVQEYEAVLRVHGDPDFAVEDEENRAAARKALERLRD